MKSTKAILESNAPIITDKFKEAWFAKCIRVTLERGGYFEKDFTKDEI